MLTAEILMARKNMEREKKKWKQAAVAAAETEA